MSRIAAVLFDLDGTLLDTAPDLVGTLNHLRVAEGLPVAPVETYRRFVSRGAIGLIREGLPDQGEAIREERRLRFLDHYARNSMVHSRAFEGVEDTLASLESRGIPWGVVTNKATFLTLPILDALGWSVRAACVVCGDTLAVNKPDPAPVRLACELAGADPAFTMMVGDDRRDIEAGASAGALPVLAAWGYGVEEARAAGGNLYATVEHPAELLHWLDGDAGRRTGDSSAPG